MSTTGRGCGCEGGTVAATTDNPPGQSVLHRRAAVHSSALARMRADLGAESQPLPLRSLSHQPVDDPALALLDSWAVVADIVAFYNERWATEGFLRTATERLSVRELARTLGYELRPGVAAQAELAFNAETAAGAPEVVVVPASTPVQSIPGPGELPQVFETSAELETRGVWNAIPGFGSEPQRLRFGDDQIWLRGTASGVRPHDTVLIVGSERADFGKRQRAARADRKPAAAGPRDPDDIGSDDERWDFRIVTDVEPDPPGHRGWTRLTLDHPIGWRRGETLIAKQDVRVHLMTERANVFGWNAPDPNLLAGKEGAVHGAHRKSDRDPTLVWDGYEITDEKHPDVIELEGDRVSVLPGTWVVLEEPGHTESFLVKKARPDGASKFGISGRLTRVTVDVVENLAAFDRPQVLVHGGSVELPARDQPIATPVGGGSTLDVVATDPPLPAGRAIVVSGNDAASGAAVTDSVVVKGCVVHPDTGSMTLTVQPDLAHTYVAASVTVHANVVAATHGETVQQVLGSGDGRAAFAQFSLRRGPLTYVRSTSAAGAKAELTMRVDAVEWSPASSLDGSGPSDRVYALHHDEGGGTRLVVGDGTHGARLPTGSENVTARYRVGIGSSGEIKAAQIALLTRRPLGIRDVANPAPSHDWADEETLEEARTNAPLRVRTLDRAVSVADFEDFARGYAGVGATRAELVWNGQAGVVVVSLLAVAAAAPSRGLLADLRTSLDGSRDPGAALLLLAGQRLWFGVRVEVDHDPAYERTAVHEGVASTLAAALAPAARTFAAPVTSAAVLVLVRSVPGVRACTRPRLFALPDPPSPDPALPPVLPPDSRTGRPRDDLLVALPARLDAGAIRPAQLLGLAPGGVEVGVMQS